MKKETHLRGGTSIAALISPLATLGSPIYPRHPYRPKARRGQGAMPQPSCRSTGQLTAQWERVGHSGVHWAGHRVEVNVVAAPICRARYWDSRGFARSR